MLLWQFMSHNLMTIIRSTASIKYGGTKYWVFLGVFCLFFCFFVFFGGGVKSSLQQFWGKKRYAVLNVWLFPQPKRYQNHIGPLQWGNMSVKASQITGNLTICFHRWPVDSPERTGNHDLHDAGSYRTTIWKTYTLKTCSLHYLFGVLYAFGVY